MIDEDFKDQNLEFNQQLEDIRMISNLTLYKLHDLQDW